MTEFNKPLLNLNVKAICNNTLQTEELMHFITTHPQVLSVNNNTLSTNDVIQSKADAFDNLCKLIIHSGVYEFRKISVVYDYEAQLYFVFQGPTDNSTSCYADTLQEALKLAVAEYIKS